jgi:hypothetical protein
MRYSITVREKWNTTGTWSQYNTSKWEWELYDDDEQLLDQGTRDTESQARKAAELAADLDYKIKNSAYHTYTYSPPSAS